MDRNNDGSLTTLENGNQVGNWPFADERVILEQTDYTSLEENLGRKIRIYYILGSPILIHLDWLDEAYDPNQQNWSRCYCCCFAYDPSRQLIRSKCDGEIKDKSAVYHDTVCTLLFGATIVGLICCPAIWYNCCIDHKGLEDPVREYGPYKTY